MYRTTSHRTALLAAGLTAVITAGVAYVPTAADATAGSGHHGAKKAHHKKAHHKRAHHKKAHHKRATAKRTARNSAPRAAFTTAASGFRATFAANRSNDPDGRIASYAWTYGDGTRGTGVTARHTFTKPGEYSVTLKVTDNRGATSSVSKQVTAAPDPAPVPSLAPSPVGTSAAAPGAELGMYRGNPSESPDAAYLSLYGKSPSLTSSYYTTQGPNESYESGRVKRGTDVFLDFDTKSTPGQIGLIAKRDPSTISNWVDRDLKSAETIAAAGKSAGGTVYVSFTHEWEVKRAQNVLTNASDRDPATYAAAWNVFAQRARAIAPDVKLVYWVGGFSSNFSVIDQVMAGFNFRPDVIAWDPYVTKNGSSSTTATQLFASFANHLNGNASYIAWGKPTKALGEFGFSLNLGDAAAAKFYAGVADGLKANGISLAIQFDRDKQDPTSYVYYKVDGGSYPQAQKAFAASADLINK